MRGGPQGSRGRLPLVAFGVFVAVAVLGLWISLVLSLGGESSGDGRDRPGSAQQHARKPDAAPSPGEERVEGRYAREGRGGAPEHSHEQDLPEGGAHWEPAHDPLGTGAEPGDLSETERGRVVQAARSFVTYAYGYSGDDRSQYESAVNRVVVAPNFYETPGGRAVNSFAESVESGGTSSTAALQAFEIRERSIEEVEGVARFSMGGSEGSGTFEQDLRIAKWGAAWRVEAAGEIREAKR